MKLFVRNLAWKATDKDLSKFLDEQGYLVTDVRICINQDNGQSRGFGFVTFASVDMGEQALRDLPGEDFMGRPLQVEVAIDKPKKNQGQRSSGGSPGHHTRRAGSERPQQGRAFSRGQGHGRNNDDWG